MGGGGRRWWRVAVKIAPILHGVCVGVGVGDAEDEKEEEERG